MLSNEIRRKFLSYFQDKKHAIIPSSPVVPHDDPTLLFNNAGMNQFKDVFLGKNRREYTRAASSQKCIRVGGKHNDLDNVGHTSRHLTFFEMLGNFSFGDYFKKEAIAFAFEVTTKVFEFPLDKLWITVFENDDEAFELWKAHMPEKRILRFGEKDNFWAMGETGPCGPCSELYLDRGPGFGSAASPQHDSTGERYIEFWNLVFMQFNRDPTGKLDNLPKQSIDTGAGLERIISLKMGVDNVFQTDILRHLIGAVERASGQTYRPEDKTVAPAFHVIADHIRSLSFAIADGAQPSNIERGYVLRKLIRRAVRYGKTLLHFEGPFLASLLPELIQSMGADYPELVASQGRIEEILTLEEESFLRTLKRGGDILSSIVEKAMKNPRREISGEDAFKLKDTYGFPLEEILLIAKDSALQVNIDAYQLLEEKAKELSRSSRNVKGQEAEESLYASFAKASDTSHFVGYSDSKASTEVMGIVIDGDFVDVLPEGREGLLILKQTPFYAEKGGQVADHGTIRTKEASFTVTDCLTPFPKVVVHKGKAVGGTIRRGDAALAMIDADRRGAIAAHHTATHLLHYALQQILGMHIKQAGSLVEPNRLRFDFNHHKPLSAQDLQAIEDLVNEKVRLCHSVSTYEIPFQEAQQRGEIKQFFGEKYGAHVRVVDIEYSKELCGGTHVTSVGMVGYFRIIKEGSIASGVRRIEAVCGKGAEAFVRKEEEASLEAAALFKTQPGKLVERASQLIEEVTQLKEELRTLRQLQLKEVCATLLNTKELVKNIPLIAQLVDLPPDTLADLSDRLLQSIGSGVIALATGGERAQILVRVSPDLVKNGLSAGKIIKEVAPCIGGGGGGKAEMAQAGGKDPSGIGKALEMIKTLI